MNDDKWNAFVNSGSVIDYLKCKEQEKAKQNENFYQGLSNQRTDNRGE